MPKKIQNANLTTALVNEFDLKGRVELELDERIVPVIVTQDITPNPNEAGKVGMSRQVSAAVAAQLSFTMIVPAVGTRLEILNLGTTGDLARWIALTREAIRVVLEAAVTLATPFQAIAVPGSAIPAAAINPTLQATMRSGAVVGPAVGQVITTLDSAAGVVTTRTLDFASPVVLYGRANTQPSALVMMHLTVNTALSMNATVREFPDQ